MALTTYIVILSQFIVVFCNGINPSTILNLGGSYDKILPGHGYKLLKVKTLEHCHRICLYSPKCLSVNWNIKTKYCQLNSEDVGTGTPLMMSTGDLYVPSLGSNIKNHACTSSPCKFGEVCIPVTSAADFLCLLPDEQVSTIASVPKTTPATATTSTAMLTTTIPTAAALTMTTALTTLTMTTPTSSISITPKTTTAIPTTTSTTTTKTSTMTTTPTQTTTTTTVITTTTPEETTTTTTTTTIMTTTTVTTSTTTPETTTSRTTTTTTSTTPTTTPDCSTYSNSFTRFQGRGIWGLNNNSYFGVKSASQCEQYCVQLTAFTCKSYEYVNNVRKCNIMSFVKDDALSAWVKHSETDYFQRLRQCDVTPSQP